MVLSRVQAIKLGVDKVEEIISLRAAVSFPEGKIRELATKKRIALMEKVVLRKLKVYNAVV